MDVPISLTVSVFRRLGTAGRSALAVQAEGLNNYKQCLLLFRPSGPGSESCRTARGTVQSLATPTVTSEVSLSGTALRVLQIQ